MTDELRPDNGQHATELAACEEIVNQVEEAEREFRGGFPIAGRMHLYQAAAHIRAVLNGEAI
jgi:hypothetical protein